MNTTRMDTLLNRQKKNLVTDALFALIIAIGLVIYLFGLSARNAAVVHNAQAPSAPQTVLDGVLVAEQVNPCAFQTSTPVAQRC